eukprot:6188908-Pleurochrysis_carterae.AAC.2
MREVNARSSSCGALHAHTAANQTCHDGNDTTKQASFCLTDSTCAFCRPTFDGTEASEPAFLTVAFFSSVRSQRACCCAEHDTRTRQAKRLHSAPFHLTCRSLKNSQSYPMTVEVVPVSRCADASLADLKLSIQFVRADPLGVSEKVTNHILGTVSA